MDDLPHAGLHVPLTTFRTDACTHGCRYFDAVASTCGFEPGECYVAVFEPHGLHDHTSEWHLVDITNPQVKIMHGKMPYAELEKMQPCDLTVKEFEARSVLGKKGQ